MSIGGAPGGGTSSAPVAPGARAADLGGARAAFCRRLLMLAGLAFGLRLVHVRFVTRALGSAQILDAAYYHDLALAQLGRQSVAGLQSDVAFGSLAYPVFLRAIYALVSSPTAALIVQALLGAATVVLVGLTARQISRRSSVGLLAAGVFALYAPAILYDGLLVVACASAFASALLGWALCRASRRPSWQLGLVCGAAVGLAALLRASQLLLLPLVAAAMYRLPPRPSPGGAGGRAPSAWARRAPLVALLLATLACVVPPIVRGRLESGAWVALTSNGGMNFWIGNHRGAAGVYSDPPFLPAATAGSGLHVMARERDGFLAEARRRSGDGTMSLADASRFWWRATWGEIATAVRPWLGVMLQKVRFVLNGYEPRTNASMDFIERVSPVLRLNPLRFGALLVLAALGIGELRRLRSRAASWWAFTLVAPPVLTCLVFFVSGEYRHPAAPALAVLAALALDRMRRTAGLRALARRLRAWPRSAPVLGLLVLVYLPVPRLGPGRDRKAYAEALATRTAGGQLPTGESYALARALLSRHGADREDRLLSGEALLLVESNQAIQFRDPSAAARLIAGARTLWAEDLQPDAGLDVATIERIRSNSVRRVAQLCRQPFVGRWPAVAEELDVLGCHAWEEARVLLDQQRLEQAEGFLRRAWQAAPHAAPVLAYLGRLEQLRGGQAAPWFERSLRSFPRLALPALMMAEDALRAGDRRRAQRYAQEALAREPDNLAAQRLAATVQGLAD